MADSSEHGPYRAPRSMNWGALALGGLAASIALEIGFWLSGTMSLEWRDPTGARALASDPSATAAWMLSMLSFGVVLGFASAWVYAAIRPRFGPGPLTAVRVGVLFSALLDGMPIAVALASGQQVKAINVVAAGFFLVVYVVAALLAGLFYWETPESRHRRDSGRWPTSS